MSPRILLWSLLRELSKEWGKEVVVYFFGSIGGKAAETESVRLKRVLTLIKLLNREARYDKH
jgi:hypothetical protein